jgi:hypothetical protein
MRAFRFAWPALAAAVLAAAVALPPTAQARDKKPVNCTRQYDPVCTRTVNGVLTTFTNACAAKAAGAAVLSSGHCDELKCPPIRLAVCARKDGKNRTFDNACVAEKEGAVILLRDRCPERCEAGGGSVCAVGEKGTRSNYADACAAVLQGARVLHKGDCLAARTCGKRGFRVCATAPNGVETQYASLCRAEAANASWVHNGKCKPGIFRRLMERYGIVKPR